MEQYLKHCSAIALVFMYIFPLTKMNTFHSLKLTYDVCETEKNQLFTQRHHCKCINSDLFAV